MKTRALEHDGCVDVSVIEGDGSIVTLSYDIGDFAAEPVKIGGENYYLISLDGEAHIMDDGMPRLPKICRSIIIPDNAQVDIRVVESRYSEYQLKVAPSRGFISRQLNPDDIPYEFSEEYSANRFYPGKIAELGSPYILRDFRGITVSVYPFVYNSHTRVLRAYSHISLEIFQVGNTTEAARPSNSASHSRFFAPMYESRFLNYDRDRYQSIDEHGRMVVISHGDFMSAVQPYVDWKRQKGIYTDLVNVADIGVTADDIKGFIQSEYDADDGLTFVQLVGDVAQIPTFLIDRDFCDGQATSDATYALLDGNDSYPDILVGRFSAGSVADVETQVERTIHYEKELANGDWLHKGTGVGSAWGEGYGYMGLSDRDLVEVLRIMLIEYTYSEVDQLYEMGEPPFGIIPVDVADFIAVINEGRGILNIEGHADCEATFMIPPGTPTGERFTTDSVYRLHNEYMLPFVFIGAPYLGNFQIDVAFPEAWLRATSVTKGSPIGAIAVFASSTDLDYASPQAAQHEMVELLVNETMSTFGGLMYNGACYSVDLYGTRGEKTLQSYNIFGDVSLQVRTDKPESMTVLHESTISAGSMLFNVTVVGVEGALCAISRESELLGTGYSNPDGNAVIEFGEPISGQEPLDLVVTAYNSATYIAQIAVAPVMCGDANSSGAVDIDDAVHLISYIFSGGPAPEPIEVGDVDCSGAIDIDDVVFLVGYIFSGGYDPCDTDGDGQPDC